MESASRGHVIDGTTNDYQPQVSPDGTKLCFTREVTTKDVFVAPITGGAGPPSTELVTDNAMNDDYECAWSPDQSLIAFPAEPRPPERSEKGTTATGATSTLVSDAAVTFDGNPEWTINLRPSARTSVSVAFNSS